MAKKAVIVVFLTAVGLTLGGCSRCGWIWDDWRSPSACRSDHLPAK
jgi:hypothetical protein